MYVTSCPNLVKRAINEVGYCKKNATIMQLYLQVVFLRKILGKIYAKLNNWFSSGMRLALNEAQFVSFIQFQKNDEGGINNLLKKKAAYIIDVHRPLSSNKKINFCAIYHSIGEGSLF